MQRAIKTKTLQRLKFGPYIEILATLESLKIA